MQGLWPQQGYDPWRGLCNSVKLWAMLCRATQEGQVIVESSDKTWSTGGRNGKLFHYSCHENPMNSMKRQKDITLEDEPPQVRRSPICYWGRVEHNYSWKNEEAGPKWKWCSVVNNIAQDPISIYICKDPISKYNHIHWGLELQIGRASCRERVWHAV